VASRSSFRWYSSSDAVSCLPSRHLHYELRRSSHLPYRPQASCSFQASRAASTRTARLETPFRRAALQWPISASVAACRVALLQMAPPLLDCTAVGSEPGRGCGPQTNRKRRWVAAIMGCYCVAALPSRDVLFATSAMIMRSMLSGSLTESVWQVLHHRVRQLFLLPPTRRLTQSMCQKAGVERQCIHLDGLRPHADPTEEPRNQGSAECFIQRVVRSL